MGPEPASNGKKAFQRLPTNAVPINYSISIKPDFQKFTFEGVEEISVEVKEPSPCLVLNARELQVHKVGWRNTVDGKEVKPIKWNFNEVDEWFEIFFNPPLPPGNGTLHLTYTGILNDKMKGFYRSKNKTQDGIEYYNGVTQFEATNARRAFLCWDELAIKATFDVTLIVPKDLVAISNMPVKEELPCGDSDSLKVVKFDRTPKMSTFILGWVVGNFDYVEAKTSDGILCRVYTPPSKKEQGQFALQVTAKVLPYYKEYFGIAYPLSKIDLVAVADFSFGAMENWGILIFRETCLLVDEQNTSASYRQTVALVVGHEIAHQWFGNLVSPEWWTHLWLKEGFASFIEYLCVDHLFPDYDIWSQFVTHSHIYAMELDCLRNSHAIEIQVGHPSEIDEIFDAISYNKGSAIIRMLHNYIGDVNFRKGMNIYLTRHQYANAFTEDLWQALAEASAKPVAAVMKTWTTHMGFPLIRVTGVKQQGNTRTFTISQERFVVEVSQNQPQAGADGATTKHKWMVPIKFTSAGNSGKIIHEVLLDKESVEVVVNGVSPDQWIKLNPGLNGFYRVQYPSQQLERFIDGIKSKSLPALDRLGILDDVFALAQAGRCPTADLFKMLPSFVNEDNYTVWSCIGNVMNKLGSLIEQTAHNEKFMAFGRDLFRTILGRLGWERGSDEVELGLPEHLEALLRRLVLQQMVNFQEPTVIAEAKRRFKRYLSEGVEINVDLRSVVYKAVIGSCDAETFAKMIKLYRDSSTMEEKERIGGAMSALSDNGLIQQALEFAISPDVRNQDTCGIVTAVAAGKHGQKPAWEFFKNNREVFYTRYTGQLYMASNLVKGVSAQFTSPEQAKDVEDFFTKYPFPGTEMAAQQAIETIHLNAAWLTRIEEYYTSSGSSPDQQQ